MMAVTDTWIEPGTTVISACWVAYRDLDAQGYTHRTINHSIGFVDQRARLHVASCKDIPQPVQQEGGLHLPSCTLKVRGEAQGRAR